MLNSQLASFTALSGIQTLSTIHGLWDYLRGLLVREKAQWHTEKRTNRAAQLDS